MPTIIPTDPAFPTESERVVFQHLVEQLADDDLLICGQRLSSEHRDYEIDFVVAMAGVGVVVVEVKGSGISAGADGWTIRYGGRLKHIDPVQQAHDNKYQLIGWLKSHSSLPDFGCWAHAVVLPFTHVDDEFAMPQAHRGQVAGRDDMPRLGAFLRRLVEVKSVKGQFTPLDLRRLRVAMQGFSLPQRDLVAVSLENDAVAERRTQEQSVILDVARLLPRIHVRGGAGTGKTWLAVEHARRLAADGLRVALMCYSRGLAAWLQRRVQALPDEERPSYVGTFHGLGVSWGAPEGSDDDSDYWEHRLPELMVEQANELQASRRFDAIVIDEGQDFADAWWLAVHAALVDDGRLAVFTDEGQQVFSRFGGVPGGLVPLVLDRNLRNTRQVAAAFETLAPIRMKLGDLDGPPVRLIECAAGEALDRADDAVDRLLDEGWSPRDVALLATGTRHSEQRARQDVGQDSYWESFWDDDQVFYGHVLGFKGLERNAVVLAINDTKVDQRAKEKLYVGLSRAREQLIVCGDPAYIEAIGGPEVLHHLRSAT